jgi:hypothetical protein
VRVLYRPRIDLFVSRALSQFRDFGIGLMLTAAYAPIMLPLALVTECVSALNVHLQTRSRLAVQVASVRFWRAEADERLRTLCGPLGFLALNEGEQISVHLVLERRAQTARGARMGQP